MGDLKLVAFHCFSNAKRGYLEDCIKCWTSCRSPGYGLLPQTLGHSSNTVMANDAAGASTSGLPQQYQFLNTTFAQSPQCSFVPSQFVGFNGQVGTGSASEAPLDLKIKLIENQIEVYFVFM